MLCIRVGASANLHYEGLCVEKIEMCEKKYLDDSSQTTGNAFENLEEKSFQFPILLASSEIEFFILEMCFSMFGPFAN